MSYFPLCVVGAVVWAAVQQFLGAVADTYHVFLHFRHVLKWLLSSSMAVNSAIFTALSDILSADYNASQNQGYYGGDFCVFALAARVGNLAKSRHVSDNFTRLFH
jgi:hypothetical protein